METKNYPNKMIQFAVSVRFIGIYIVVSYMVNIIFVTACYVMDENNMEQLYKKNSAFIISITALLTITVLFIIFKESKVSLFQYIELKRISLCDSMISLFFGMILWFIIRFTINLSFFSPLHSNHLAGVKYLTNNNDSFIMFIALGLVQPVFEEILYRGVLYNKLKGFLSPSLALIIQAILFGVVHYNVLQSLYSFILGLIFCIVYKKQKTLYAPVIMHCTINCLSLISKYNLIGI